MDAVLSLGLANVAAAVGLAVLVAIGCAVVRRPWFAHKAWLLLARGDTVAVGAIMKQLRDSNALADRRVAATVALMNGATEGAHGSR